MVSECEVFFPAANAHTFSIQIPPGEFAKRRKDTRSGVKFDVTVEVSFFAEHCGVHLQGGFGPPRPRKGTR